MKKIFFSLLALCAICACQKDPDSKGDNPGETPVVAKLDVVLDVRALSADITDNFDVEYTYVDFAGKTNTKKITGPGRVIFSIENPVLSEKASNFISVGLTTTKKTGVATKASYSAEYAVGLGVNGYDKNGKLFEGSLDKGASATLNVTGTVNEETSIDEFAKYITRGLKITTAKFGCFFSQIESTNDWRVGIKLAE